MINDVIKSIIIRSFHTYLIFRSINF